MKKKLLIVGVIVLSCAFVAAILVAVAVAVGQTEEPDGTHAHSLTYVEAVAATCTEAGNTAYYYCSECGKYYLDEGSETEISLSGTVIAALGHDYADPAIAEPSCTVEGYWVSSCTRCGDRYTETISAKGHTAGEAVMENEVAATCTEDGSYDTVVYCTVCGEELSRETAIISATGHTAGKAVKENETSVTCTEDGSFDTVVYCMVCGEELSRERTVVVLAHSYAAKTTKEATCTEDGVVTYTCKVCGDVQTETIAAFGHTYSGYNYDKNGHWQVCTVCGTATDSKSHTYNNNVCTVCGYEKSGDPIYTRIDSEYLYFGSYPQTEVTDTELTAELLTLAGTLPTSSNSYNWTSYGYYISGSNSTDYMWYIDRTYDGITYRGVYFTSYRPYYTTYSSSTSYSYQDDNGYDTGTVYWFRYDRIKWRILAEETSGGVTYATILCETLVESQAYQNCYQNSGSYSYVTDNNGKFITDSDGNKVCANNYAYSTIRKWLNETFYNTAFSSLEQAIIQTVTVDNSASTTGYTTNNYACADTSDKVWLLSHADVTNSSYGFGSNYAMYDTARRKLVSDYARCQGIYSSTESSYVGCGTWWLRSPFCYSGSHVRIVFCGGNAGGDVDVSRVSYGVCPALKIILT